MNPGDPSRRPEIGAPRDRPRDARSSAARAAGTAILLLLAGCPAAPPPSPPPQTGGVRPAGDPHPSGPTTATQPSPQPAPKLIVVATSAARPATDAAVAYAEVAWTNAQRERGLMGRDRLEPDHGMLFVYPRPVPRKFWMKGCTSGLDIAFLREDGTISNLVTLGPGAGLPDAQVPTAESDGPVLHVLEMEPGWFAGKGIAKGDRVDVSAAVAGVVAE